MVALAILGILAGISVVNASRFRAKAEYAAIQSTLRSLMDGEDLYFVENDTFYPDTGSVNVASGAQRNIPELAYNFASGHKHSYTIQGMNTGTMNWYIITVRSDVDLDGNGRKDQFIAITIMLRGKPIITRRIVRYR
jgi:type II secretory pathway pseudopilin PulG